MALAWNLTSSKKSKRSKLLLPRKKKMGPVDTVIQEITDEDGNSGDIVWACHISRNIVYATVVTNKVNQI